MYTYFLNFQNCNPRYHFEYRLIGVSTLGPDAGRVDAIHQDVKREQEQGEGDRPRPRCISHPLPHHMDVNRQLQRVNYRALELSPGAAPQRHRWGPPHGYGVYARAYEYLFHPLPEGPALDRMVSFHLGRSVWRACAHRGTAFFVQRDDVAVKATIGRLSAWMGRQTTAPLGARKRAQDSREGGFGSDLSRWEC